MGYGIFNSDTYVKDEVDRLVKIFDIDVMVETGTFEGESTRYMSQIVKEVHSIEIVEHTYDATFKKIQEEIKLGAENYQKIKLHLGDSGKVLKDVLEKIDTSNSKPVFFYLDAHWHQYWPILDELKVIGKYCYDNAVIVIDDFQVPGTDLGYDEYDNVVLNYEFIKADLDNIYSRYAYYYNTPQKANGYRRGKIYIYPYKECYLEEFPNSQIVKGI